jgi:hypothetical protein
MEGQREEGTYGGGIEWRDVGSCEPTCMLRSKMLREGTRLPCCTNDKQKSSKCYLDISPPSKEKQGADGCIDKQGRVETEARRNEEIARLGARDRIWSETRDG